MKRKFTLIQMLFSLLFVMQFTVLQSQTNQYLHFDREDDYVILEDASSLIVGEEALTMTGWFYTDELAYGQGMFGIRSSAEGMYLIQLSGGIIECRYHNSAGFYEHVAPAGTVVPQMWQHFAWVYDGSEVKLYVDGALNGSTAASGSFSEENIGYAIGKSIISGLNFVFGGRVDEITLWKKALSQQDILDMMENEVDESDEDLVIYYKFNQGVPAEDNTSITKLVSETGSGENDADLLNFALTGETSNFNGTVNVSYQAIIFPQLDNHLTTDAPFDMNAIASSGLPVSYSIESGPATVEGNTLTLTGEAGEIIVKASQAGNDTYDPAEDLFNAFMALDPATFAPEIDPLNPLAGDVYIAELKPIQLAVAATIDYPELFSVASVEFQINGQTIIPYNYENTRYINWWTPPAYGSYTLTINSTSNLGALGTQTVEINIVEEATDIEVLAFEDVWLGEQYSTFEVEAELPSFLGAFDEIWGTLELKCPDGGCGEWDRVASVDIQGKDGEWIEIIHYITPYSTACSHNIDLTDYMSLLQGKVKFRANCVTYDNGYLWDLTLNYSAGTPEHFYSAVSVIWQDIYPFGDYADLTPVIPVDFVFPQNAEASTLKLVSSGHGWGALNTGNAAEFHEDTHHIWINGEQTFVQHNWADCNPNPDGCQPQNGTWYYDRAGWCPGSIAPWFDFDMTEFIGTGSVNMDYIFNQDYVDLCHPNHPDCVTGSTCTDCDDGFNPQLHVACNLVVFGDEPLTGADFVDVEEMWTGELTISPNPSKGLVNINVTKTYPTHTPMQIFNISGAVVMEKDWDGENITLDMSDLPKGVYIMKVQSKKETDIRKIIIQ